MERLSTELSLKRSGWFLRDLLERAFSKEDFRVEDTGTDMAADVEIWLNMHTLAIRNGISTSPPIF